MVSVIGYTYEADYHCIACTKQRYVDGGFSLRPHPKLQLNPDDIDIVGIPLAAEDNEGNPVHPIFSTDELPCDLSAEAGGYNPVVCGDCGDVIRENDQFDAAAEKAAKVPHVVLIGNFTDGFTVIGVFESVYEARHWARNELSNDDPHGDPWWIMPVKNKEGF